MYLNVTDLLCKDDKIVGFECDKYSIDQGQLPRLEKSGIRFMSGLDIELFIEDIVFNNPNRRNNIIIISEQGFEERSNIYYYQPTTAVFIEPPIKGDDSLLITLRVDGKESKIFFNSGSAIYRNVLNHICKGTNLKVLRSPNRNREGR